MKVHKIKGVKPRPVEDRFWEKVLIGDGCWEWFAGKNGVGYGAMSVGSQRDSTKKVVLAHRLSYQLNIGPIPEGMFVCHRCDNPPCVRPSHLFIGDDTANVRDMLSKGRGGSPHGEQHCRSRFRDADISDIRAAFADGENYRSIAVRYASNAGTIYHIVNRATWHHLP